MELTAQKRTKFGKKSKSLRFEGLIPAAVFGKGMKSENIELNLLDFKRTYTKTGETELIDIKIEGDGTHKCLVKEVQYDPITMKITHVGFYKPDLTEKISADIPVEVVGEENNELVLSGNGLVLLLLDSIEVSALPTDLPHAFKVNVADLAEIGEGVTVAELEYDKEKVEIVGLEEDTMLVKIDYAEMEEEPEEEISEEEALAGIEATEETAEDEDGEEQASGDAPAEKQEEATE